MYDGTPELRESEEKYRGIFESIDTGCCIIEVMFDGDDRPIDYVFLEANPAFAKHTGLFDALGKSMRSMVPAHEAFWFETYGRIARTGVSERFEHRAEALGRWYSVFAFRVGSARQNRVAVLFEDILERKSLQAHTEFLDEIGKILSRLSSPDEIMRIVGARVGQYLGISGFLSCEVSADRQDVHVHHAWTSDVVPNLKQTYHLPEYVTAAFERANSAGLNFIVRDTANDERVDAASYARLKVGAFVAVPILRNGEWVAYLAVTSIQPRDWRPREIHLLEEISDRLYLRIERARIDNALRASERRFRQFADASSGALWIRDAASLKMEFVSPAIAQIYGVPQDEFMGDVRKWAAAIVPEDRDGALAHLEAARGGDAVIHEFRIQRTSDREFRWIRDTSFPLFDEHGRVERIGGIAEDVTDARLAVEHQGVLLAELQHRVRNIMTIFRTITVRTGERAQTVEEYAELVSGRLLALSRVQTLLTQRAKAHVSVSTIVHDELAAKAASAAQFTLEGADIALSPKAAEVLTLAVHELATNALKYGAFSQAGGRVAIRWSTIQIDGKPWFFFDWMESGVPIDTSGQRRRGFGSELIEGRLPYELDGIGKLDIDRDGARCHLEFPLAEGSSVLETGAPRTAKVFGGALDMKGEPRLNGHRVLVVEDEYFIATDTARALSGAGANVLGPVPSERMAARHLESPKPDAVVLDINLGHGPSFELAGSLRRKGIPFLFMTGYDQDVIPKEFRDVVRLQKPTELRQIIQAVAKLLPHGRH